METATKTKTQHTPSPWEDNGNGLIYGQCSGDDDEAPFVADVCKCPNIYTDQERANARMVEAAPELLEALETMQRRFKSYEDKDNTAIFAKAEAAIAKARAA